MLRFFGRGFFWKRIFLEEDFLEENFELVKGRASLELPLKSELRECRRAEFPTKTGSRL